MKYGKWFYRYNEEVEADGGNGDGGDAPPATDTPPPAADTPPPAADTPPPAADTPADWPADWRAKITGDAKHLKTLDRFASPNAMFESYVALRSKVDSGELRANSPFPAAGTPEEQAAWRKSHDIPESPDGYQLELKDGLVIGEADKPAIESFMQVVHNENLPPSAANAVVNWYYELQEKNMDDLEARDATFLQQSEDSLRAEWGGEYRTNVNMIKGLVGTLPESVRDLFTGARMANGDALINHPDMARWLVHTARTINPTATVVPNNGGNIANAIEDEIASIEEFMRKDRAAYNKDEKMQERLRLLYAGRERAK